MFLDPWIKKYAIFPFRNGPGSVVRKYSIITSWHLLVRWFSCPFEIIADILPRQGVVYDLGCGHGLLVSFLLDRVSGELNVVGTDLDKDKIAFASAMNSSPRARFEVRDVIKGFAAKDVDGVILNDVLHLLPYAQQERLLNDCYRCMAKDAVLVIKEIDRAPRWKYVWTRAQEFFVNNVFRLTMSSGFYCRSRENWEGIMRQMGFQVRVIPADRYYPYSHVIYVCRKS